MKETGFESGGRARNQWWRQTAAERQLKTTLKDILEAARDRRRRESVRHGEGKRGAEDLDSSGDGLEGGGDGVFSVFWDGYG